MSTQNTIEYSGSLLFRELPTIRYPELAAAWEQEGYGCEPMDAPEMLLAAFRGENAILLEPIVAVDLGNLPEHYPAMAALPLDYDATFLINHQAAYADFQRAAYEVPFTYRTLASYGKQTALLELALTLLGLRQALDIEAVWLDHAGMFVGKQDLQEFTDYVNTQDGMPPESVPYPLFFGVHYRQDGNGYTAWSRGLVELDHPEIFVHTESHTLLETVSLIFNSSMFIQAGRIFQPGESLSCGAFTCTIAAADFNGVPACQLLPQ